MKNLILILFSLPAFAQFEIRFDYGKDGVVNRLITADTEAELATKAISFIEKYGAGTWTSEVEGALPTSPDSSVSLFTKLADDETTTLYLHSEALNAEAEDMTEEIAAREAALAEQEAIDRKFSCGQSAIRWVAKNNIGKGLTTEQIKQMASTYSEINQLLMSGAIDTAKIEIQAITADGVIVTEQDKTDLLAFIAGCE